jgi:hypothetical protein
VKKMSEGARQRSDAARSTVLNMIREHRSDWQSSSDLPDAFKKMDDDEVLTALQWEFQRLPLIHNAPLENAAKINDDTKMMTTLTNGYLQNVAQRYLLGVESKANLLSEGAIMVKYLGCTPYKIEDQPTLRWRRGSNPRALAPPLSTPGLSS